MDTDGKDRERVPEQMEIRGAANADELKFANELMAKVFGPDAYQVLRWMEGPGRNYPAFRPDHTRMLLLNGEVAAALRVTTDTIRLGEARLKMGGFGYVATATHHRHKGLGRELLSATMRWMADQGYHVSMLFGIPNFYSRFGFTTSLAEYSTCIPTLEASHVDYTPYTLRAGKPGDIRALQRMHNDNDAETACSLVRSAAHIQNAWERWRGLQVLTNKDGKVVAYFLASPGEESYEVRETGLSDRSFCGSIIHACLEQAADHYLGRIRFHAPPTHPLMQYLIRYRSTHEMRAFRNEGGMMAFVDLGETLESLVPEWEHRVQRSEAAGLGADLTLLVDRTPYRIRAHHGAISVTPGQGKNKVSLSSAELMHLCTGYRYADEIIETKRRIINTEGRVLLRVLFPKRHPFVWPMDRF